MLLNGRLGWFIYRDLYMGTVEMSSRQEGVTIDLFPSQCVPLTGQALLESADRRERRWVGVDPAWLELNPPLLL